MYPQAREWQRTIPEQYYNSTKKVVTADFKIPIVPDRSGEDVKPVIFKVFPRNVKGFNPRRSSCSETSSPIINLVDQNGIHTLRMFVQIGVGEDRWNFNADFNWLWSLNPKISSSQFSLIRGTIHFRSKYFGSWEPFEFIKHFVVWKSAENSVERVAVPIFTAEQLENTLALYHKTDSNLTGKFTLEMTLTVERVSFSDKEDRLLRSHAAEMNNALIPTPPKSDFRIKVEDEEFFVHLKHIKAFSCVSETLSKYVTKSDWSDLLSPDSMQALLRFIYYCEVDMICNPEVTFDLMRFGHMYQVPALFKICRKRLIKFPVETFTVADLFDIYMFVRIPDEFQQLKRHFCRILSVNAAKYDTTELRKLAKQNEDGSGVDALVEILQFVPEEKPDEPSTPKRPRIASPLVNKT